MKIFDLKAFRADEHLRQSDIASLFKCGQSNISAIEKGYRSLEDYQRKILVESYGEDTVVKYEKDSKNLPENKTLLYTNSDVRLKDILFPKKVVATLDDIEEIRISQQKDISDKLVKLEQVIEKLINAEQQIKELRGQVSDLIKTNQKLTDKIISLIN